jgi:ADP-heptose:LPS heptosyltransferase
LELSKHFDITVLTSKYNDFILRDFLKTKIFIDSPLPFSEVIKMIAKSIFSFRPTGSPLKAPEYDLYLDLNGIKELNIFMDIKKRNLCRYYVDFNLGPWNLFLDYAAKGNSVLFSKKQILDSYRDLVKGSLGLDIDVPDYVELGSKGIMPQDFNIEEPYILINISGFDKYRGPSPKFFAKVVDALNFKGKIVVMDDLGRPNLTHFRQAVQNNTVVYLDKNYSPWELLAIAGKSLLYIGSDSGISHLLQIPVSAALFFGNPPALVWRPYSKNEYTKSIEHKTIIEKTTTSHKLHKMIIYNQLWCGTCFDIGCRAKTCLEFDINFTAGEINKLIGQIKIGE